MRRLPLATTLVALGAVTFEAHAYVCKQGSGTTIAWVARCIPVTFAARDPILSQGDNAARAEAALALWMAPACTDLELVRVADGANPDSGIFVVTVAQPVDPDALIVTETSFKLTTGEIYKASIEMSPDANFGDVGPSCQTTVDLTNAVAREIGLALGFIRDPASANTVLGGPLTCQPRFRSIGTDDVEGVCAVYPAGGDTATCVPPPGGYDETELRPDCGEAAAALGEPCKSDVSCREGLTCDPSSSTCALALGRGCTCESSGGGDTSRWPLGFLVFPVASILRARWRRASSR